MPNNYGAMNMGYMNPYQQQPINPGTGNYYYGTYTNPTQQYVYQAPVQNTQSAPMPVQLNGRIVESKDVLAVTEVPVGSYGIFPKTDFSEIYVKHWTPEGTTKVDVYQPNSMSVEEVQPEISLKDIQAQVSNLTEKVDSLVQAYVKPKVNKNTSKESNEG